MTTAECKCCHKEFDINDKQFCTPVEGQADGIKFRILAQVVQPITDPPMPPDFRLCRSCVKGAVRLALAVCG